MKDNISLFFAITFLIIGLAILFLGKDIKHQGMLSIIMFVLCFVIVMRERVTEFVFSYKEVKVKLDKIENKISDIAEAMETLTVAQQINSLGNNNTILLDYEPIPQSVRIVVGPIVHFPRKDYGYDLQGKIIYITHSDTLNQIIDRLPGGVTIEYLRKVKIDK